MSNNAVSRRTELILVALILFIAGILRMGWPGLTEFKADEARLLSLALDMAEGQFALRGISSSVGFPNFPASVWIYSLPLFIWPHPYAATIFTGLLNVTAVAACYWFVRRYWGVTAALVATLMLAVSPWAIIFSRKIWAQNLLPLFVMGWAIGAALAFVERRPRFIWLHFLCLALAVQIHLAAVALVPATLILLVVFWRRVTWKAVLIGGILALLTILPFALYLWRTLQQTGLPPSLPTSTASALTLNSIYDTIMLSLGTFIHSLAGTDAYLAYLDQLPPMTWVYLIWGLLILGGAIWFMVSIVTFYGRPDRSVLHERQAQVGLIVLLWLLIPPLFFLWHSTPVFLHYFIATLPAQYIAAGVAFSRIPVLMPKKHIRVTRLVSGTVLLATAVAQLWAITSLINFVGYTNTPGAFGTPLVMKLEAVETAKTLMVESGATEIIAAGPGEAPKTDEFAAEYAVLLRDVPHRFVDTERSALFPAQTAIILLNGKDVGEVWTGDLYQATAVASTEILLRPEEGALYVLTLPGHAKPQPVVSVEPPYLLANWVNLLGHDQPQRVDNATAVWQIHWRTGDNPDPANYQFFNHLENENGQRLAQLDAPAFSPGQWRAGDTVISRFLMPWPETETDALLMRVGMYRYPSLENVPLLDEAANPYADAASFPIENSQ